MSTYDYLGLKRSKEQLEYKNGIRERDHYTCQLCGQPGRDVDHIIPYSISCDSSESNLRVLCHSCNCKLRMIERKTIPFNEYEAYLKTELAKC